MDILVVKTINELLKPAFEEDLESFKKLPKDGYFEIKYTAKRNIKFHRKYFALLKLAFENQSDYRNLDEMRKDFNIVLGYYDEVVNKITGEIYKMPKSISFNKMDNVEFSDLYERTKDLISKWLGINDETIENEIMQYY